MSNDLYASLVLYIEQLRPLLIEDDKTTESKRYIFISGSAEVGLETTQSFVAKSVKRCLRKSKAIGSNWQDWKP